MSYLNRRVSSFFNKLLYTCGFHLWRFLRLQEDRYTTPFSRKHLDRFNRLKCKPDLEVIQANGKPLRWNAKKTTNVVAAWIEFKRAYGLCKKDAEDVTRVVYAPNKRMRLFLQHLTKWQVKAEVPTGLFFYFGINPDKKELQTVFAASQEDDSGLEGGVIVGTKPSFIYKIFKTSANYTVVWDDGILGPNKHVTSF